MTIIIAVNNCTNKIYAGTSLKYGVFGKDKQDVTIDALFAVAEHCLNYKKPVILSVEGENGLEVPKYKITVEQL